MKKIGFKAITALMLIMALLFLVGPANASLIGDTIEETGVNITATGGGSSATIGPGIEFTAIGGLLAFDFAEDTLTVTSTHYESFSWCGGDTSGFTGFDEAITGFTLISSTGFETADLFSSFTSNSILFDFVPSNVAAAGATAVFGITQGSSVPEPATMVLFGFGLLGIAGFSRRKK